MSTSEKKTAPGNGSLGAVPLGRWCGVPVRAHWSVLLTVALFAVVLSRQTLPALHVGAPTTTYWVVGCATALVFFVTLIAHELAHAVVARRHGVVVLDITLWLLGGSTRLESEPSDPAADAAVAAAGPLTSLVVGTVLSALALVVGTSHLLGAALWWTGVVNLLLAAFNILPGAPLDGGRLLRALLWSRTGDRDRAASRAAQVGRGLGLVLVGGGLVQAAVGSYDGVWLVLVGWFVLQGAASERARARVRQLGDLTAADVMRPVTVVPAWRTIEQFLDDAAFDDASRPVVVLVDLEGRLDGARSLAGLSMLDSDQRAARRMSDLRSVPATVTTTPTEPLQRIVGPVGAGALAVVLDEAGRPCGAIASGDLVRAERLSRLGWRRSSVARHRP